MQEKAVSCGELVDTTISADRKMKTFKYNLTEPTSAPNIGLAIGPFDIHVDRAMPEMTHFCLHGLQKELKARNLWTVLGLSEIFKCPRHGLYGRTIILVSRSLIKTTTAMTYQAIVYYEELLSARFPFTLYKQVFVSKLPEKYKSYR